VNFLNLYHLIIEQLLIESVNIPFLAQLNAEIEVVENLYRKKDKQKFKSELKIFKKRFIAKLVKENYNSILTKFFPFLIDDIKTTDDDFYKKLFNTPEIWENMTPEEFKDFVKDVESSVDYFSSRNHSEFSNLKFLSIGYIKY
jgi:hypothetical protein